MSNLVDVFGPGSNFKERYITDYKKLGEITKSLRLINLKIVLVMGTYDLTHIGHARYLEKAKEQGAVVIVGVDPDKAVKIRKGPRRPIVPEIERMEMLTHLRHVDLITLAKDYDSKGITGYKLVQIVKPDIFVISRMNKYTTKQTQEIKKYAKKLVVFPEQAQTTTSARIRLITLDFMEHAKKAIENLSKLV